MSKSAKWLLGGCLSTLLLVLGCTLLGGILILLDPGAQGGSQGSGARTNAGSVAKAQSADPAFVQLCLVAAGPPRPGEEPDGTLAGLLAQPKRMHGRFAAITPRDPHLRKLAGDGAEVWSQLDQALLDIHLSGERSLLEASSQAMLAVLTSDPFGVIDVLKTVYDEQVGAQEAIRRLGVLNSEAKSLQLALSDYASRYWARPGRAPLPLEVFFVESWQWLDRDTLIIHNNSSSPVQNLLIRATVSGNMYVSRQPVKSRVQNVHFVPRLNGNETVTFSYMSPPREGNSGPSDTLFNVDSVQVEAWSESGSTVSTRFVHDHNARREILKTMAGQMTLNVSFVPASTGWFSGPSGGIEISSSHVLRDVLVEVRFRRGVQEAVQVFRSDLSPTKSARLTSESLAWTPDTILVTVGDESVNIPDLCQVNIRLR